MRFKTDISTLRKFDYFCGDIRAHHRSTGSEHGRYFGRDGITVELIPNLFIKHSQRVDTLTIRHWGRKNTFDEIRFNQHT
jgi:hypothetical protein